MSSKIYAVIYMNESGTVLYRILYPCVWALFRLLYMPKVSGAQYIPKQGAVILAGNHKSNLDCIAIASCTLRCVHYMAKDELFKGAFKYFFRAVGAIPVNRRTHDAESLSAAGKILQNGGAVGIFPEGKFNKTNETVLPFKPGTARMAIRSGAQLVPFTISGKYRIVGRRVRIDFYPPIETGGKDAASLSRELENTVRQGLERNARQS